MHIDLTKHNQPDVFPNVSTNILDTIFSSVLNIPPPPTLPHIPIIPNFLPMQPSMSMQIMQSNFLPFSQTSQLMSSRNNLSINNLNPNNLFNGSENFLYIVYEF